MKINYALTSRSLIALLFVIAGIQKITGFQMTSDFIGQILHVSSPSLAAIATLVVIAIEVPVAISYALAWKYPVCVTGGILAGFTVLATLLVHNHLPADLVMILKNIAIVGGILATMTACDCGTCPVSKKK